MYEIRNAVEADYEAIAVIGTLTRPEPFTAAEVLQQDRRAQADKEVAFQRLVAADPTGRIVGYGFVERSNWEPEGRWSVYACSHPDVRCQGVGQALLTAVERIALEAGATELMAWCRGTDDNSLAWAERRGYVMNRQRTESVLDLTTFDPSRFAGHVDRVRESGITLALYEGTQVPEPLVRGIYELDRATSRDVPAWDAGDTFPTYEQYHKDWMEHPDPYCTALALDGEQVVGISSIYFSPTPGKSGMVGYTAVLREYRGRGIALAVKLLATEEAMRRGAPRLRTNNDPDNPPMLAINVKMGFQFIPGPRRLVKQV
ncbi:MAG TPA: GNAT family N-acetyltransferase [Symbiobacteriaceae bacterium]|nr:GNAT family N-acetyltransferase [Symbiobacteriaceae bacterium]